MKTHKCHNYDNQYVASTAVTIEKVETIELLTLKRL